MRTEVTGIGVSASARESLGTLPIAIASSGTRITSDLVKKVSPIFFSGCWFIPGTIPPTSQVVVEGDEDRQKSVEGCIGNLGASTT